MSTEMVRALTWCEYDFMQIDADIASLRLKLLRAAPAVPRCKEAAKKLRLLRTTLRQLLASLDADITAAVQRGRPVA